ncbi:MAG: 5'-nucleotidase, lipoprotein e(P4) family [Bacteroidia bacterium]|nr:MAG: 5'-nucleotidase, lipoprotein e(P4) family [Bacteroidia bacterium]
MRLILSVSMIIAMFFVSCNYQQKNEQMVQKDTVCPPHSDHLVMATLWFQKSAECRALQRQTYRMAQMMLEQNLKTSTCKKKKAVVMDVDETILDNSPFEGYLIRNGLIYTLELWQKWTAKADAKLIAGAGEFIKFAKSKNVEVFYVSNRRVNEVDATLKNLKKYDLPYTDTLHTYFRTDESSKTARRNLIKKNYEILMLIGDNLTDFDDLYKTRKADSGFGDVDSTAEMFGSKYILLPNPMYGDWEKTIYGNTYKISAEQRDIVRKKSLESF